MNEISFEKKKQFMQSSKAHVSKYSEKLTLFIIIDGGAEI